MTTKSSQPTAESGQKPKIKPCRDLVVEQAFELETLRAEVERLRNLLVETARALGLDTGDVDDLPQKAAAILAEGSAACQEWSEKCDQLQEQLDRKQAVLDAIRCEFWRESEEAQKQPDDGCGTGGAVR